MTAVEWLEEKLKLYPLCTWEYYLKKAKEMEQKQLKEMYLKGIEHINSPF